ncbi:MAG: GNAT family protein [Bacteroidota bacterium]
MLNFNFSKQYILENELVQLSPLGLEHIEKLIQFANDHSIWVYFLEKGDGKEAFSSYIKDAIDNRKLEKEYPFVILDKRTQQFVGTTRIYDVIPDLRTIKMGHTWLGTAFQSTGLNKNCKYLLFEFAFETVGAARVGFGVHGENTRSQRAMESVGCKKEGVLRSFLPKIHEIGRTDLVLYSLLQHEWLEKVKDELQQKMKLKST